MKVVYVAGPYNAATPREIEFNIRRAEDMALEVAKLGASPIASHPMTRFLYGSLPEEFWRAATMAVLERCDAMVMTAGWEKSDGTHREKLRALALDIPIFTAIDGLESWLRANEATDKVKA